MVRNLIVHIHHNHLAEGFISATYSVCTLLANHFSMTATTSTHSTIS